MHRGVPPVGEGRVKQRSEIRSQLAPPTNRHFPIHQNHIWLLFYNPTNECLVRWSRSFEFGCRLLAGEMPADSYRLAHLRVETLDRVGSVEDLSDFRGRRRRMESPAPSCAASPVRSPDISDPTARGRNPPDLAPSFIKRRNRRCRKCFSKRYGSATRGKKATAKK